MSDRVERPPFEGVASCVHELIESRNGELIVSGRIKIPLSLGSTAARIEDLLRELHPSIEIGISNGWLNYSVDSRYIQPFTEDTNDPLNR